MKTYVLMVAKYFPATHPRAGEETFFKEKMLCGALYRDAKIHTMRLNYDRWKMIVDEVNAGRAILSVRQWKGKPYNTKQEEFLQITKNLGIQKVKTWVVAGKIFGGEVDIRREALVDDIRLSQPSIFDLAHNDGLSRDDFESWFGLKTFEGCILHFSRLRYPIAGWFEHEGIRYRYDKEMIQASEEFRESQRIANGL